MAFQQIHPEEIYAIFIEFVAKSKKNVSNLLQCCFCIPKMIVSFLKKNMQGLSHLI